MKILKFIGASVMAMGMLLGIILGMSYIFPLLKSFNLPDVMIFWIIALIPILVRIIFISFTFYRNPASRSGGLISLIINDLIILSNFFLPFAIVIVFAVTVAFPSTRQSAFFIVLIIVIPLRILLYQKRISQFAGITSMILSDIIQSGVVIVPLVVLILLGPAYESSGYRQLIFQVITVYGILIISSPIIFAKQFFIIPGYKGWCQNFMNTKPESVDVSSKSPDTVYGVLVSFGLKKKIEGNNKIYAVSVSVFSNGYTSVKSSLGNGLTHPDVFAAISPVAIEIVEYANNIFPEMKKVSDIQMPQAGSMNFYFLTTTGLRYLKVPPSVDYTELDSTSYITKRAAQIKDYANIILMREHYLDLNEPIPTPPLTTEHPLR